MNLNIASSLKNPWQVASRICFVDLALYIAVMFLIREVYFEQFSFISNGLFWSIVCLIVATGLMRVRGVTWRELGLVRPESLVNSALATVFILVFSIGSILLFQAVKSGLGVDIAPDVSNERAASKFGDLVDNWPLFFTLIPFIWMQSMFEELLDRGFLMNWIEKSVSTGVIATLFAVVIQAMIFGFRHSHDLSDRSITVGLIGLGMGLGYIAFGRNLWPLVVAHCLLNTMSMLDRV